MATISYLDESFFGLAETTERGEKLFRIRGGRLHSGKGRTAKVATRKGGSLPPWLTTIGGRKGRGGQGAIGATLERLDELARRLAEREDSETPLSVDADGDERYTPPKGAKMLPLFRATDEGGQDASGGDVGDGV